MNTTSTPSTATVKTTVLDALEQATEGRVDNEGFYDHDGAFYLTCFDLAAEVRMSVDSVADLAEPDLNAKIGRVLAALEELDAAVVAGGELWGVFGWRLVGPAGDVAHALLADFEV